MTKRDQHHLHAIARIERAIADRRGKRELALYHAGRFGVGETSSYLQRAWLEVADGFTAEITRYEAEIAARRAKIGELA